MTPAHSCIIRLVGLFLATAVAFPISAEAAPLGNGDVNGSGGIDISDAVHLLSWLFLGSDAPVAIVCPPPGGGPLPATGQTKCYGLGLYEGPCDSVDLPGQDGFYAASCPSELRFVDNGDGSVTDHCTGLVWQQDTADTNGDGSIGDEDRLSWGDALRFCDRLVFAGHSDWRLPNARELGSLVDYGRTSGPYPFNMRPRPIPDNAAMDPVFGAQISNLDPLAGRSYWSSTSVPGISERALSVLFECGHLFGYEKTRLLFVRAVRLWQDTTVYREGPNGTESAPSDNGDVNGSGGIDVSDAVYLLNWLFNQGKPPVPVACPARGGGPLPGTGQTKCFSDVPGEEVPCDSVDFPGQDGFYAASCPSESRFVDNGDGTVTDHSTGLVWQKDTADTNGDGSIGDEDQLLWGEALRFCDRLAFAGRSDWRLPNVRELHSLVNYGRDPLIDPIFGAMPRPYWTSTTHLRTADEAWFVSFGGLSNGAAPVPNGGVMESCEKESPGDVYWCHRYVRAVRGGP